MLTDDLPRRAHHQATARDALVSAIGDKPAALVNAVTTALTVCDPDAPVITDSNRNPKPDPGLRGYENVPLPPNRVTFDFDSVAGVRQISSSSWVSHSVRTGIALADSGYGVERPWRGWASQLGRWAWRTRCGGGVVDRNVTSR